MHAGFPHHEVKKLMRIIENEFQSNCLSVGMSNFNCSATTKTLLKNSH